ncbi:MAG TPA: hypothetical protein VNN80_14235 [Polyangiaceae bacterium]|nr:hypothetical protein [Polyangiaceae bacterium]
MNERTTTCLSLAAALALSASSVASAEDLSASRAPSVGSGRAARVEPLQRPAHAAPTLESSPRRFVAHDPPLPGGASTPSSNPLPALAKLTKGPRTLVLSDELFEGREPLELLSSVILPAARGVTIAQIQPEGATLPAVTLTVRPTKIKQGGGLVAVAQF